MRIGIQDIVKESGYSRTTVSRALNGSSQVAENARRKIQEIALRLGYRQNRKVIAIIVPSHGGGYYWEKFLEETAKALEISNYHILSIWETELELIESYPLAGAVAILQTNALVKYWNEHFDIPLVCINTTSRHLDGIYSIYSNEEQGMSALLRHLIALGHRRIAVTCEHFQESSAMSPAHIQRLNFYRKIMRSYGFPDDLLLYYNWQPESLLPGIRDILDRKATVIISLVESHSQRLLFYLHELGLKVPDDISVCGWLTDYDKFCIPPITGAEQNFPYIAKHAVVTLNKLLNHESVAEDIVIDYNIFIRQSTGPAKEE